MTMSKEQQADDDALIEAFFPLMAELANMTPEQLLTEIRRRSEKQRQRMLAKNAKYRDALSRITDVQAVKISKYEANGFEFNSVYQNKHTKLVAIMMGKTSVYDPIKGKMGAKTLFVYPDGHSNSAYGRTCTLEKF